MKNVKEIIMVTNFITRSDCLMYFHNSINYNYGRKEI